MSAQTTARELAKTKTCPVCAAAPFDQCEGKAEGRVHQARIDAYFASLGRPNR